MTTTVKIHVGGRYKATVVQKVDGETHRTIEVGQGEEKSLNLVHDKPNTFEISEEQLPAEENGGIPPEGFSAQQAADKAAE